MRRPRRSRPRRCFNSIPTHPVPTIGGGVSKAAEGWRVRSARTPRHAGVAPSVSAAARAQRRAGVRERILKQDAVLAGPVEVTLYAASTATDTDFTAKLIDVYPPSADFPAGFRHESNRRHRARELSRPFQDASPAGSGRNLQHRRSGHSIPPMWSRRVIAFVWIFPAAIFRDSTSIPIPASRLGSSRLMKTADNTIYHDPAHPSAVKLFLLPSIP